jgi:hypothetical protein
VDFSEEYIVTSTVKLEEEEEEEEEEEAGRMDRSMSGNIVSTCNAGCAYKSEDTNPVPSTIRTSNIV